MAIKELKTRIALRTGDYAYWTTGAGKDIELYKGEVCVCTVTKADNQAQTAPTVLFKVANANGQKFADLDWVSGLAADVYAWAKKENPDWTDFPALPLEVVDNGTGKFVTDFTYTDNKLTITRSDVALADISDKEKIALSADLGDVTALTTTAKTAVGAINEHDIEIDKKADSETVNAEFDAIKMFIASGDLESPRDWGSAADLATAVEELHSNTEAIKMFIASGDVESPRDFGDAADVATAVEYNVARIAEVQELIGTLPESTEATTVIDYIDSRASEALEYADGHLSSANGYTDASVSSLREYVGQLPSNTEATTVIDYIDAKTANIASDETVGAIADRVTDLEAKFGEGEGTVEAQIAAAVGAEKQRAESAEAKVLADSKVTITETVDGLDAGVAKKYTFTQNGAEIGSINLAKELVVTSGSVKEVTEANVPYAGAAVGDKYIELVIANQAAPIYVPAKDLVDIYTAKDGAAEVQVAISNTNEISATIVNVPESKLEEKTQTALGLARTALQSHQDITGKADKKVPAVAGNIATLDANGNLADSGKQVGDFANAAENGAKALAQGVKDVVDANKATWDKAGTALQAADLADYAKTADVVTNDEFTTFEATNTEAINNAKKAGEDAAANVKTGVENGTIVAAKATDATKLGGVDAANYALKSDIPTDHLTEITTTENGGLKVTNKNQIDIDTDVIFVLNANF